MMRAMLLEFPQDQTAAFLDRQYMLGESLLVAPIFAADGQVTYYVPAGRWTNLVTGATLCGRVGSRNATCSPACLCWSGPAR